MTSGPEGLGDLHGEGSHPAGGADDQHVLPGLHFGAVPNGLQRGERGHRHRGGLLKGEIRRLRRQFVGTGGGVLGEAALADAEDLVADLESRHLRAERDDRAGDLPAPDLGLGGADAVPGEPYRVRHAGHQMPDTAINACRVNPEQYLAGRDIRPVDLREPEHVRGIAVLVLDDRRHR